MALMKTTPIARRVLGAHTVVARVLGGGSTGDGLLMADEFVGSGLESEGVA